MAVAAETNEATATPAELLARIDTIMRELGELRGQVFRLAAASRAPEAEPVAPGRSIVEELWGAAGHGSMDEFDEYSYVEIYAD